MAVVNKTGTISGAEAWDWDTDEYHATGSITVSGAGAVTITGNANPFRFDGNYFFDITTGKIVSNGTQSAKKTWQANANPRRSAWAYFEFNGTGAAGSSITFNVFKHVATNGVLLNNATAMTFDDNEFKDCDFGVQLFSGHVASTMNRIRFVRVTTPFSIASTAVQTLNDWYVLDYNTSDLVVSGGNHVINRLVNIGGHRLAISGANTYTTDELYAKTNTTTECVRHTGTGTSTLSNCVLDNGAQGAGVIARTAGTIDSSGNDIENSLTGNGGGLYQATTSDNDHIRGTNGADADQIDTDSGNTTSTSTPVQYVGLGNNRTNARAARNKPLTTSGLGTSGLGQNGITITWTSGIKSSSIVRYGTVSGTYTMRSIETENDWTGLDGGAKHATAHSVALVNLAPGTTYYYQVGGFDPINREITWSAEQSFATTAAPAGGASRSAFAGAGMRAS